MKRILLLAGLGLALLLPLAACGREAAPDVTPSHTPAVTATPSAAPSHTPEGDGPLEEAGDAARRAVRDAGDAVKDAADKAGEKAEEMLRDGRQAVVD